MLFKKAISFVLCFAMLIGSTVYVNSLESDKVIDMSDVVLIPDDKEINMSDTLDEETTYYIPEIEGKYKAQGRTIIQNGSLIVDHSASGIEFNANCQGDVKITFDTSAIDTYGVYFTIIIDGEVQDRDTCHITATGETTVTIAEDLLGAVHNFEIYRQSESPCGTLGIKSITINGILSDPPRENGMSIEFVGDGVTSALGNLYNGGSGADIELSFLYQDATKGYAYLTAKKLGADFSVLGLNGIGASVGWQSHSMLDDYTKMHFNKDDLVYDFSKTNDVVVVALGKSDYDKLSTTTESAILQGFKDLLELIRTKNPTSKIVWIYGMQNSTANSAIASAVSSAGGSASGYYTLDLSAYENIAGGNYHPYYTAHEQMADALADFINQNFDWADKTVGFTTFKGNSIRNVTTKGEQGIRFKYSIDTDILTNGYQGYTVKQIGILAIKDKYLNGKPLFIDGVYENKKASVGLFYDAESGKNMISDEGIATAVLYNIGYNKSTGKVDFSAYSGDYTARCYMLVNDGEKDFYLYDDYYLASVFEVMQEIEKEYAKNPSDEQVIADNEALETILGNDALIDKNTKTVKNYYDGYQTDAETYLAGEIVLTSKFRYTDAVYTVDTDVVFTNQSADADNPETITVPAYWNGGKEWIVRYALPTEGDWKYTTYCTDTKNSGLHYITGSVNCTEYSGDLDIYKNGFLKVEKGKKYITYADGTPFFYLGDTHWSLPMESLTDGNGSQYVDGTYRPLTDNEISALKTKYKDYDNIDQLGEVSQFEFIMNYRAKQGYTVIQSQQLGRYNTQGGDEGNTWMADINGDVFEQGITSGMLEKFNTLDKYFSYIAELGFVHAHSQYSYTEELIKAYKHNKITNKQLKKLARYWVARYSAYPVIWTTAQEVDDDHYGYHNIDEDGDGIVDGCTCAATDDNACKPWYDLMNYVAEYDPYNHPNTAHQEGMEDIDKSYFADSENYDFDAAQQQFIVETYESETPLEMPWNVIKKQWNKNWPVINYEGAYNKLWASEKSARAQGWISYLNGMFGYGYGTQPIFNFFWARQDSSAYYDPSMTWVDGVYAESAEDMSIMKEFFTEYLPTKLGINWWELTPNFKDGSYYTPNQSEHNYTVATAEDKNSKITYIGYFAGSKETADLGRLLNMSKSTTYYYHWYDTSTGKLVKTYTFTSSSYRTWNAVAEDSGYYPSSGPGVKPNTNDLLLVVSTTQLSGDIS